MAEKSQDVATQDELVEIGRYQGEAWETLKSQAHEVEGADFTKGDLLIGVPFIVVAFTLRSGDYLHQGCGKAHPYMYMRAVVGPEHDLRKAVARGRLTEEKASYVDPGEVLGWNEAGTGVYRQLIGYLESQGFIKLPEGPVNGAFGESRFDSLPGSWEILKGDMRFGPDGQPVYSGDIRLDFPRGLRVSEYQNEYTKEGRTRYAA